MIEQAGMGREIVQRCRQLGILLHASLASHDSLALGWPSPMRAECVTWTQQVVRLLDSFFELQDSSQSMDLTTRTSAASSTSNPTSTLARALFSPSDGECPHGGESGENDEDDESDEDAEVGRSFSTAGLQGRGSNQEVLPVTEFSSRAPVAPGMLEASQGRGRAMSAARIGRAAECRSAAGKGHASHAHACAMLVQTRLEAKVDTTIASLVDLREGLDWSKRRMQARLSALQKALEVRVAEERKRPHPDALLAAMHAERAKWEAQRGELAGQLEAMKAQLDKERGVREGRIELQTHLAQMLGDISAVLDEARMAAEGLESDVVVLHGEMERMGKCMCAKLQRVEEEMEDTKSLADRKTVQTLGQATQAQANLVEEEEMRKKLSGEFSSQLLKFELRVGVLERERDGLQGELAAGMRLVEDLDGQLVAAREARKKVCTQLVVEEERAKELEARVGGLEEQAGCLREQVRDRERVACGLKRSVDCLRADLSEAQSSARRQDRQSKAHIRHLEKQVFGPLLAKVRCVCRSVDVVPCCVTVLTALPLVCVW